MKVREVLATFKHIFVKRKYKDILFRYVFREKREILQLYNAINQTNYTNADDLVITTMEDVIYIGMKNDLSFIIMNEMNLYEHQSTLNENMPLRGFLYFARLYESYIETHKKVHHPVQKQGTKDLILKTCILILLVAPNIHLKKLL